MPDPNEKYSYQVVQEGRDGAPLEILGQNYKINDTILLTEAEAKYLIGLSIEPTSETKAKLAARPSAGEHRESGIDVDESTRIMQEPEAKEEDTRTEKRGARSTPAKE